MCRRRIVGSLPVRAARNGRDRTRSDEAADVFLLPPQFARSNLTAASGVPEPSPAVDG